MPRVATTRNNCKSVTKRRTKTNYNVAITIKSEEDEDGTEVTQQDQKSAGGQDYQNETLVPFKGVAESCYLLIVDKDAKPVMNIGIEIDQDDDKVSNVHEFDEEQSCMKFRHALGASFVHNSISMSPAEVFNST